MDAEAQRKAVCSELIHKVALSYGEVRLKVTGSSMLPAIWPGDEITVMHCEYAELRTGQIVLYRKEAGLTAHRIERITQDYLVVRGDSLVSSDPPVFPDEIVGCLVNILRNNRDIQPRHSSVSRIVSLVLRRSDFSRRIALYLARRKSHSNSRPLRCSEEMQP